MKTLCIVIGLLTLVTFFVTGLHMRLNFPDLYQGNEAVRFLFRANHIYILSASLVQIILGLYMEKAEQGWRRNLQILGTGLCLLASPLLIAAFFIEPTGQNPIRPLTGNGLYALFGGVMTHILSQIRLPSPRA